MDKWMNSSQIKVNKIFARRGFSSSICWFVNSSFFESKERNSILFNHFKQMCSFRVWLWRFVPNKQSLIASRVCPKDKSPSQFLPCPIKFHIWFSPKSSLHSASPRLVLHISSLILIIPVPFQLYLDRVCQYFIDNNCIELLSVIAAYKAPPVEPEKGPRFPKLPFRIVYTPAASSEIKIDRYSSRQDLWTEMGTFCHHARCFAMVHHNGKVIMMGGRGTAFQAIKNVWIFCRRVLEYFNYSKEKR